MHNNDINNAYIMRTRGDLQYSDNSYAIRMKYAGKIHEPPQDSDNKICCDNSISGCR
jgi:hypothetical protein